MKLIICDICKEEKDDCFNFEKFEWWSSFPFYPRTIRFDICKECYEKTKKILPIEIKDRKRKTVAKG